MIFKQRSVTFYAPLPHVPTYCLSPKSCPILTYIKWIELKTQAVILSANF